MTIPKKIIQTWETKIFSPEFQTIIDTWENKESSV